MDTQRMTTYAERIRTTHAALGIPADYAQARGLFLYDEADPAQLAGVGPGIDARDFRLIRPAAARWEALCAAAGADGVGLLIISAYRSVDYQYELIERKLKSGESIHAILQRLAAPGCSEHHTGRALDLATPEHKSLDEAFETTSAFAWLMDNAGRFGFHLSYPRDNPHGIMYEPWHWAYRGGA